MKKSKQHHKRPPYVLLDTPRTKSEFAEAYRTLRANIGFLKPSVSSLLITSAAQGEGKTITSYNLAHMMARSEKKTVVIDGDMRKPMLSRLFGASEEKGLSELLSELKSREFALGDLSSECGVYDLLHLCAMQERSGTLHVAGPSGDFSLQFVDGRIVHLERRGISIENIFLESLRSDGLLNAETADAIARKVASSLHTPLELMDRFDTLSPEQRRGAWHLLAVQMANELSGILEGEYAFSAGRPALPVAAGEYEKLNRVMRERLSDKGSVYLLPRIMSVVRPSKLEGLSYIPCGAVPVMPGELIESDALGYLFRTLKKKYDMLILDTPPIMPAADALLAADKVDGMALVVKAGYLKKEIISKTVENIRRSNANLTGIIVNNIKAHGSYYSYNYYSRYYGGYYKGYA